LRILTSMLARLKRFFFNRFFDSAEYWETRYESGGDSGAGSYDELAVFKASFINQFIRDHKIQQVMELGCGDGNQLSYYEIPHYRGFDVSETAIKTCKERFALDNQKEFLHMREAAHFKAEMTMSIDVIYHLTENSVFTDYMKKLFRTSSRFVIIYSSDFNKRDTVHVRHRKFTDWVKTHIHDFELVEKVRNKYPFTGDYQRGSFADFYIYRRNGS